MSKYAMRRAPLALAVGTALASGGVQAVTITVTSDEDAPVGFISDECTLRDAVVSANSGEALGGCAAGTSGFDEIVFDDGLLDSTITLSEGQIEVTNPLAVEGPATGEAAGVVIDADQQSRIFRAEDAELFLRGLTLTGGLVDEDFSGGGAIYVEDSILFLDSVLVTGNETQGTDGGGGGLYLLGGELIVADSEISDNATSGSSSGSRGGGAAVTGSVEITNSRFEGNATQADGRGGGIDAIAQVGDTIAIHGSEFIGNAAVAGGGGLRLSPVIDSAAEIHDSIISGNTTESEFGFGGGVDVFGDVRIFDSEISGNSTEGETAHGGGVHVDQPDEVEIGGSTISDNTTSVAYSNGGGLAVRFGEPEIAVTNSTVSGNDAGGEYGGGGIYVYSNSPEDTSLTLTHATLADNANAKYSDSEGDAVYISAGTLTLNNSLLVGEEDLCNTSADEFTNTFATDESCTGTGVSEDAIGLEELADNGGPTPTHALGDDSVAIDGGGDCQVAFEIDADQRGMPRPGPGSQDCDIGAYELGDEVIFSDRFE